MGDLRRPRPPRATRIAPQLVLVRDRARRSATRSRASCRCTRASSRSATTGDAIQWGGTRLCEGGNFPTPDGKAHFLAVAPTDARRPGRAASCSARGGASSSTRWCTRRRTRSPARSRDALFMATADAAALGVRRRRPRRRAVRPRRDAGPGARERRSAPATCRCSSPKATCCCARAGAIPTRACPTTTPSSTSRRRA